MSSPTSRRTRQGPFLRPVVGLAAAALLAPGLVGAAHADGPGSLKHKQHAVHQKVRGAQRDLDGSSAALTRATTALHRAQSRLKAARSTYAKTRKALIRAAAVEKRIGAQLAAAKRELVAAQQRVTAAQAAVDEQRRELGVMAARAATYGDSQMLTLAAFINGGSLQDISADLSAAQSIQSKQLAALDTLDQREAELAKLKDAAATAEKTVATRHAAAVSTLATKKKLEGQALTQRNQVTALVASQRKARKTAAKVRAHDVRELKRLQRQENRIRQQILAQASHDGNRHVKDTGGMLFRPVPGYVTSPYGWRIHPIYHYWGLHDGTDFHAPCGTPERAANSGKVLSEYYSDVWGNRLYLDLGRINGHNYTVIYNHINKYAVGTGARVARGQTVAYAGTTGWSTGCHLHFTVMRDGTAVNPMDYIK